MLKNRRWVLAIEIPSLALFVVTSVPTPAIEMLLGEGRLLLWFLLGGLILEKGVIFDFPPFMTRYAGIALPVVPLSLVVMLWAFAYPVDLETFLDIVLPIPAMLIAWLAGVALKRLVWRRQLGTDAYMSMFAGAAPQPRKLMACVIGTVMFGLAISLVVTVMFGSEVLKDNLSTLGFMAVYPVVCVVCSDFRNSSNPTVSQGIEDAPAETLVSQTHMSHDSV